MQCSASQGIAGCPWPVAVCVGHGCCSRGGCYREPARLDIEFDKAILEAPPHLVRPLSSPCGCAESLPRPSPWASTPSACESSAVHSQGGLAAGVVSVHSIPTLTIPLVAPSCCREEPQPPACRHLCHCNLRRSSTDLASETVANGCFVFFPPPMLAVCRPPPEPSSPPSRISTPCSSPVAVQPRVLAIHDPRPLGASA
jgi:hypothetical protein